jgi:hypothetical protein
MLLALLQIAAEEAESEPSKVPFFICGGAFAAWAIVLFLVGMRRSQSFPGSQTAERGVIAVSAVLMAAAMFTAVITA